MSDSRLWLIGGTSESAVLAEAIAQSNLPCTITVTTETAKALYSLSPLLRVKVGRLNPQQVGEFLQAENIVAILDASHPYAVEISKLAIATATKYQIPYLRYERLEAGTPLLQRGGGGDLIILDSFETLVREDYLTNQRVLLTSGYKSLHLFRSWQNRCTLFVRVLPSVESVQGAIDAGFTANRIIAIRPPVSRELEKALWQQWQISLIVTKASGVAGGEDIKRSLCTELGIRLIIIERPQVNYPQQTSDITTAIEFCRTGILPVLQ